jgi:MurNAc alpha-1-phosphate uridylyltransferase
MNQINQVFIFCAGRGERMRPITDSIPKPLVKINNKSILDYILPKVAKINSIQKIIINGFYLANQISDHLKNYRDLKIEFSLETEKLETGGGLKFAKDKIDFNQPLLLINGDVIWLEKQQSDIELLTQAWFKSDCDLLLGLKKIKDYHGFEARKNGKIGDFNMVNSKLYRNLESDMDYAYIGMQIINPKILNQVNKTCFSVGEFFNMIDQNNQVKRALGVEMTGEYFHIGDVKAIKQTEELLQQNCQNI